MYYKCSNFSNTFSLFSNKMLVIKAGIHKMFVRITNREDLDQTASVGSGFELLVYIFGRDLVLEILEHLP